MQPSNDISRLLEIMARLRDPETGCPWDVKQSFETIVPYTIEEAHEVADAIHRNDMVDLADELGDLLLQVVFHARMAEEAGHFAFGDVVKAITTKMIRRHPHVFGNEDVRGEAARVKGLWERIKADEKADKKLRKALAGNPENPASLLDDVPATMPAVLQSVKLQHAAGKVGFDWATPAPILDKINEELEELKEAMATDDKDAMQAEFGDVLFAMTNLGRRLGIDPDAALSATNRKFRFRFRKVEEGLAKIGNTPEQATLDEMELLWQQAKTSE